MAHLDVVPVDESAPVAAPAVLGRDPSTAPSGGAAPSTTRAASRRSAKRSSACSRPATGRRRTSGCPSAATRRSRVPTAPAAVDELARRGVRRGSSSTRAARSPTRRSPASRRPVAAIGLAEKGTTTSSCASRVAAATPPPPPRNGPTVRLARAVLALDRSPMPARLPDVDGRPDAAGSPRTPPRRCGRVLGRADRIRPLLTRALTPAGAEAAAMARTTFAVTTLEGSPALNVIASSATAGVNIRVMPGDTVDDAIAHLRRVVDDDEVEITRRRARRAQRGVADRRRRSTWSPRPSASCSPTPCRRRT